MARKVNQTNSQKHKTIQVLEPLNDFWDSHQAYPKHDSRLEKQIPANYSLLK